MARGDFPSAKQDQFMVRFPDGMRDEIKRAADILGRSMNTEIVQRLAESLEDHKVLGRLKIDIPAETFRVLITDAGLHRMSFEDRAVQIIEAAYDRAPAYKSDLNRDLGLLTAAVDFEAREAELIEKVKAAEVDADRWKHLYQEKVRGDAAWAGLSIAICEQALGYGDQIPKELYRLAENILSAMKLTLPGIKADLRAAGDIGPFANSDDGSK